MTEDGGGSGNGSGARNPQPAIDAVLETLADDPRLVHVEHTTASAERTAMLTDALEPTLAAHVPYEQLWSHQVTAIEALRGGRSTVVATGTDSLCGVKSARRQITPRDSSNATSASTQRATGHSCVGSTRSGWAGGS